MMTTRIIIAGSRRATYAQVRAAAASCPWFMVFVNANHAHTAVEIVSGKAPGADTHGEAIARRLGWKVVPFPANWRPNGKLEKTAGNRRNLQMARYAAECDGKLIACWDGRVQGTANMIAEAYAHGLQVHVYDSRVGGVVDMAGAAAYVKRYGVPEPGCMRWTRWY